MLARIRKSMEEKDQGFTLIELLVVMIIIGILAAIAIPVFLSQRDKGREAGSKADAKVVATEIESALTDGLPSATVAINTPNATDAVIQDSFTVGSTAYTYRVSPGQTVTGWIAANGTYCVQADHSSTTAREWRVNAGGLAQGTCPAAP